MSKRIFMIPLLVTASLVAQPATAAGQSSCADTVRLYVFALTRGAVQAARHLERGFEERCLPAVQRQQRAALRGDGSPPPRHSQRVPFRQGQEAWARLEARGRVARGVETSGYGGRLLVLPQLLVAAEVVVNAVRTHRGLSNANVRVTSAFRSPRKQRALIAPEGGRGRSKPNPLAIPTTAHSILHAVDIGTGQGAAVTASLGTVARRALDLKGLHSVFVVPEPNGCLHLEERDPRLVAETLRRLRLLRVLRVGAPKHSRLPNAFTDYARGQ